MKEYAFGIDLGGTTAKVGLFTTSGKLLEKWEVSTDTSNNGAHILENLAAAVQQKMQEKGLSADKVEGVGLGVPGPVLDSSIVPIVCANLPYNITTPAITALIESKCFESITVLVQKEVAERLCAAPGTSAYGAFSVFMQYYTEPELLFAVPRECFEPQPKVTSAVLRAVVRREPPVEVEDEKFFFRVVYAAFALRRKTLVNSLMTAFGSQLTKEQVTQAVTSCGLEANIRGERLGLSEFAALSAEIAALL